MMTKTIETLAALLHSLNPRLLRYPPPAIEVTGHDICYLGPNGEDDLDQVIFCRDLQDDQRPTIGSWYLQPERHIVESTIVTITALLIVRYFQNNHDDDKNNKSAKQQKQLNQRPPALIRLVTVFMFAMQLTNKLNSYDTKVLQMLAPCNVLWILAMILHFHPNLSASKFQGIVQLHVTYIVLPIVAIAVPDLSDLTKFWEVPMFFLHHILLILIPVYYVVTRRVSLITEGAEGSGFMMAASLNARHWLIGCAYFSLLYFPIVSLVSIWSGTNLNYMLSPPPNPGDILGGDNFRLMSVGCCSGIFMLGRAMMVALELFLDLGMGRKKVKSC